MANPTNREITYVLRARNESQQVLNQFSNDIRQRLSEAQTAHAALADPSAYRNLQAGYQPDLMAAMHAAGTADQTAEVERITKAYDDLRSKIDPLYRAEMSLTSAQDVLAKARKIGIADAGDEKLILSALTKQSEEVAAKQLAHAESVKILGLSATAATRDLRVLFDEASSGRMRQLEGSIARTLIELGMANPAFGVFLAAVAATTAAFVTPTVAIVRYNEGIDHLNAAMQLHGQSLGLTTSEVEQYSQQISKSSGISESYARTLFGVASGYKLTGETAVKVVGAARDFAAAMNLKDPEEGAKKLAEAMQDPAKAAKELSNTLHGFLTPAEMESIENLQKVGDTADAQALLIGKLVDRIHGYADESSGFFGNLWASMKKGISNDLDEFARFLEGETGNAKTNVDKIAALQKERLQLQTVIPGEAAPDPKALKAQLDAIDAQISALKKLEEQDRKTKAAQADTNTRNDLITKAQDLTKSLDPVVTAREKLQGEIAQLAKGMSGESPEMQRQTQTVIDRLTNQMNHLRTAAEKARQSSEDAIRVASAPPSQRSVLSAELGARRSAMEGEYTSREAGSIVSAARRAAIAQQQAQARDQLASLRLQVTGEEELARAYDFSTAAGVRQAAVNKATQAEYLNSHVNIKAMTSALLEQAAATDLVSAKQTVEREKDAATNAQRLAAAAAQGPAAVRQVQLQIQAEQTFKKSIEDTTAAINASTGAARQRSEALLLSEKRAQNDYLQQLQKAQTAAQESASTKQIQSLQDELALRREELLVRGDSKEMQAEEIDLLKLRQRLVQEGYSGDALEAEYKKRQDIVKAISDANVQLSEVKQDNNDWKKAAEEFGKSISDGFDNAVLRGERLNDVLGSILMSLGKMILNLEVMKPIQDALTNGMTSVGNNGGIAGFLSQLAGVGGGGLGLMNGYTFSSALPSTAGLGLNVNFDSLASGTLHYADGGIMTNRGRVNLHRYASGGVASTPQLALFGEGRGPEAYVPLPDGRTIPVSIKGGNSGTTVMNHSVTVQINGAAAQDPATAKQMGDQVGRAVDMAMNEWARRNMRAGGLLHNSYSMPAG